MDEEEWQGWEPVSFPFFLFLLGIPTNGAWACCMIWGIQWVSFPHEQ